MDSDTTIDPITRSLLTTGCSATVEQMAAVLASMPRVHSIALFDPAGRMVAGTTTLPLHVSSLASACCQSVSSSGQTLEFSSAHGFTVGVAVHALSSDESRDGHVEAVQTALAVGRMAVEALIRRFGHDGVVAVAEAIVEDAERQMRLAIAQIPDGAYRTNEDADGFVDPTYARIAVTVTVEGTELTIDFSGTEMVQSALTRATLADTTSAVHCAVITAVHADPVNAGSLRPIRVTAPSGTIVSASEARPVDGRLAIAQRVMTAVLGALAQAIPYRVPAASDVVNGLPAFAANGSGGRFKRDGADGSFAGLPDRLDQSIEQIEALGDVRFERVELIPDSGGVGQYRGGLGVRRQVRLLRDAVPGNNGGPQPAPAGSHGGTAGRAGSAPVANYPLRAGDVVCLDGAGGGGWGLPLHRQPDAIREDVISGRVTPEAAWESYGIRIDPGTFNITYVALRPRGRGR